MDKRKTTKNKRKKRPGRVIKVALQVLFFLFLLAVVIGIFYFYHAYGKKILHLQSAAKQLVRESDRTTFRASQTSLVYDSEGNIVSTLKAEKDVYYMDYADIPQPAIDAMIVSEDRKFFEHRGVDFLANIRAAIKLIEHKGKITQGASTITQQLARKVFLTDQVSYERKTEEIFIAQELEKKYSKNDILEFYLNNIYYANGHYGIQAASYGYFGKSANSLSLSQIAFLSAIPNSPNRYNPVTNIDNTLERRDRILDQMYADQKITEEEYRQALKEKIVLKQQKADKKNYVETYIYHCAIEALMRRQGFPFRNQFEDEKDEKAYNDAYDELYYDCQQDLFISGYRIYTSIDMEKQKLLQKSVDSTLKDFKEVNGEGVYQLQAAAVTIDNDNGRVVAIVGGRSQKLEGYTFNRGYQSYRQPGSSIKPLIVYTPSFERGYTPASIVVDEEFEDGPVNSDKRFDGKMKLQTAIERSKNTIAWKLFEELTPAAGLSYLLKMDFSKIEKRDYNPAIALGGFTVGVSPVEMASAYAALENDGIYREPTCIVKIMDSEGKEVVGENESGKQIYQENAARIMTESLTGVIKNGTAKGLGLSHTVSAGKTGTTNDKKDGWFVGYTPYYTTSVWVGYDMPKRLDNLAGSTYPGTIWHDFMEQIHDSSMTAAFPVYDWRAVLKAQNENNEEDDPSVDIGEPEETGDPDDPDALDDTANEEKPADTDPDMVSDPDLEDNPDMENNPGYETIPEDDILPGDSDGNTEDGDIRTDEEDDSDGDVGEDTGWGNLHGDEDTSDDGDESPSGGTDAPQEDENTPSGDKVNPAYEDAVKASGQAGTQSDTQ